MAAILVEGFETGDQLQDQIQSSNASGGAVSNAYPLPGNWSRYALKWGITQGLIQRFKQPANEIYFHQHVSMSFITSVSWAFYLGNGDSVSAVRIGTDASGRVTIADAAGVTRGVGTTLLDANVYHCFQVHAIMGNTGTVEVRLDGLSTIEVSAVGFDFQPGSLTEFDRWGTHGATTQAFYHDDVVCYDTTGTEWNTWTGCVGVQGLQVIGDGDDQDWLPTEGGFDTAVAATTPNAWYKLEETSGTTADNAEGTAARDGTYGGAYTLNQTGKEGVRSGDKAVLFNGLTGEIAIPTGVFDIATATTAVSWMIIFKTTSTAASTTILAGARKSSSGNPINAVYLASNSTRIRWDTRDDAGAGLNQLASNAVTLADGNWHVVFCTRSTGKSKKIYVDGALVGGPSADTMATGVTSMDWCYIARERTNAYFLPGTVSEVGYWQTAELSAADVVSLTLGAFLKYELVDETPSDDDTTYIYSETIDDVQSFVVESLPSIYSPEGPMNIHARVKKTEPGARAIQLGYKTTGTNHFSADKPLGLGAYQAVSAIFPVDDEDGDPFSDIDLQDIDVAIKTT